MQIVPQPDSPYGWLRAGALTVAPALLGWELATFEDGVETAGRIIETEAYLGEKDPASHAFRGPSGRNAPMYLEGGHIYTYLSYGIHTCMNIVTGPAGVPEAVLIRALEPVSGLGIMMQRRGLTNPRLIASGPGRLTQALGISLTDTGTMLGSRIYVRPPRQPIATADVVAEPRIGISTARDAPWRFRLS